MGNPPRIGRFSSTHQPATTPSQPASYVSPEERERRKIEADVEAHEQELDEIALSKKPPVELSERERAREEAEKRAMLDALRDTRPSRPAQETGAPESINPRVKPAPEPVLEVEVVEPEVTVPDAQLSEATARQLEAQARLVAAEVEMAEADAALVQVKADHAAARAEQTLQHHRAILQPALAAAQRQKAAFLRLWQQYGGAGRNGTTHGPLAKYARTIPVGEAQRREKLSALYREAGVLMEMIRLGYSAARAAVEATETALSRLCIGDASDFRFDQAGRACAEAAQFIASKVEADCQKLLADVKAVDGVPGPDTLGDPYPESPKDQQYAIGIGQINP